MSTAAASRRRLRTELARLRAVQGLTMTEVARAHEWSPSKVHRIENGHVTVSRPDLLALLSFYGVTNPATVDTLLTLARTARHQPLPFAAYRDVLTVETRRFLADEATACHLRALDLMGVPELLQTPDYTRAWLRDVEGLDDTLTIDRVLDTRAQRQNRLHRADPGASTHAAPPARTDGLRALFLLDEAVLLRPVGGSATMTAQLAHLHDTAERPTVEIRVLPLARGAHPGLHRPVVHLQFPDHTEPDLVYLNTHTGDPIADNDPANTATHLARLHHLENLAAPTDDLPTYVKHATETDCHLPLRPRPSYGAGD